MIFHTNNLFLEKISMKNLVNAGIWTQAAGYEVQILPLCFAAPLGEFALSWNEIKKLNFDEK